jgi:hypothetical protein
VDTVTSALNFLAVWLMGNIKLMWTKLSGTAPVITIDVILIAVNDKFNLQQFITL